MANLTFNAIDVETANRTRASICQIGIAQVQVGKIRRAASFLVNPEEPFESFQTGLHGINEEAVSEAETILSIHPKLYRLIERTPLASHSPFDKQALEKAASKYGLTMPQIKWLDTGGIEGGFYPNFCSDAKNAPKSTKEFYPTHRIETKSKPSENRQTGDWDPQNGPDYIKMLA